MRYRSLGACGIEVSEISLGCWTLGGLNWVNGEPNGWANVDDDEAIRAVNLAVDSGVTHFDNADVYGNGRAERLLARALGTRSTQVIIASKVGHFPGTAAHAYEPAHIRHQCEQSLVNLQREYIDIYYFHHGNFGKKDACLDAAIETMYRLKEEGKIRAIGLSAYSNGDFTRLVPRIKPDVLQSWANCTDERFIGPRSPVCRLMEEHNLRFVAFSPLGQGRLLGKYNAKTPPQFEEGDYRRGNSSFSAEELGKLEPIIGKLRERFGSETRDLARVALQFLLRHEVVACVIPGFRSVSQVECSLYGQDMLLTKDEIRFVAGLFAG